MLDNDPNNTDNDSATGAPPPEAPHNPEAQGRAEGTPDTPETIADIAATEPPKKTTAKKAAKAPAKKAAAKKTTAKKAAKTASSDSDQSASADAAVGEGAPAEKPKRKSAPRKKAAAKSVASESATGDSAGDSASDATTDSGAPAAPMVLFKAPEPTAAPPRKRTTRKVAAKPAQEPTDQADDASDKAAADQGDSGDASGSDSGDDTSGRGNRGQGGRGRGGQGGNRGGGRSGQRGKGSESADADDDAPDTDDQDDSDDDGGDGEGGARRRRRRGGRRRRKPSDGEGGDNAENQSDDSEDSDDSDDSEGDGDGSGSRRRRRRRRTGDDGDGSDSDNGSPRARKQRNPEDEITSIGGSTRLEAKKQRRREGREAGRRRAPIVSEAEFLARREAVDRVMVIRQKDDLTQIGVLEDKVLVEHYVARESQTSLIGNVYLGRVQNVLPSMEAAFIDIGKGRNAVLYAGEVNWSAVGHKDGQPRKIESVLSSGQTILVQVSKDPVGHKGARLTGQVSLPGRFLVYVPDGNTSGISRKLPDTERNRLKTLLKQIVPDSAGVIVRTAAEGASEEELTLDVERLTARWAEIEEQVKAGKSPQMLYGEPDLTLKVVRDLFTEDFAKLVVQGDDAWNLVENYVAHVAPDLQERLERYEPGESNKDLFAAYRVDEQIAKGLDRKVWLPSGGSLIIDRTEAMTVVDVNTGKFTGSGGNLEETVTKNNLEAAEEMVRQLRLRDIGGIIVIDFIDMVLESNRDLVLRRLVECLGRDRTRHQVAEVTSLGLVQMTRKRIGTGLLEAFSTDCEHCKGRGLVVHEHPVESGGRAEDDDSRGRGRGRGGRNRGRGSDSGGGNGGSGGSGGNGGNGGGTTAKPSPADLAKSRPPEKVADDDATDAPDLEEPKTEAPRKDVPGPSAPEQEATPAAAEQPLEQGGGEDVQKQAEPTVVGTPTASDHEPQHVPSETVSETASETPSEAPAEVPAEAPRVVTSTRRRTARRPAGPPSPLNETAPRSGAGKQAAPSAEPVEIPAEIVGGDSDLADVDGEDGGDDLGTASSLQHVPIKRKGSRKR